MSTEWNTAKSVYEFTVKDIKGEDVSLEKYKYDNILLYIFLGNKKTR